MIEAWGLVQGLTVYGFTGRFKNLVIAVLTRLVHIMACSITDIVSNFSYVQYPRNGPAHCSNRYLL